MKRRVLPAGLARAEGQVRPATPQPIYAEDFSLLIKGPRRLRVPLLVSHRNLINVLH